MLTAKIDFDVILHSGVGRAAVEKVHTVFLTADITGPDDECLPSFEVTKELLVQIAIALTQPEKLEYLARHLSGKATSLKRVK